MQVGRVEGVELLKDLIRIALVRVVVGQAPEAGEQLLSEQLLLREHVEDIFGLLDQLLVSPVRIP